MRYGNKTAIFLMSISFSFAVVNQAGRSSIEAGKGQQVHVITSATRVQLQQSMPVRHLGPQRFLFTLTPIN